MISEQTIKVTIITVFMLLSNIVVAQDLNIGIKRVADVVIDVNRLNADYKYSPFEVINLFLEKPLNKEWIAIVADLSYANYKHDLKETQSSSYDGHNYYDKSFALGLGARFYTPKKVIRFFGEVGSHLNYLQIKYPVTIQHNFGVYHKDVQHEQWVFSQTFAIGFSLGSERLRWEPYVQFGFASQVEDMFMDRVVLGSIGTLTSEYLDGHNTAFLIVPLSVKAKLF